VLLNGSFDGRVSECCFQFCCAPFTLEELNELCLNEHEHLANLTLAALGREFDLMPMLSGTNILSSVLSNLLCHHLIIEAKWVLVRLTVVKLITIRLDEVRFTW